MAKRTAKRTVHFNMKGPLIHHNGMIFRPAGPEAYGGLACGDKVKVTQMTLLRIELSDGRSVIWRKTAK